MAKPQVMISVDHVSKTFRLPHEKQTSIKGALINKFKGGKQSFERQQVLSDVSFEVQKGEFFGIVGRNGSGKSTLLKMLAGIYEPNQGGITINGKLTPFIELGVGFNHELTGRENIYLNGALLGFSRKQMNAMYQDIVDFSEIEKFIDQKLKNYSSGMQVRLAFSIAIRAKSDILLLDEVLAVGDAAFQRKCFDYFMDLKKNKQTVVLVTHDMSAVRQYCDRAVMIEKGKIVHEGDPETVAQEYQKMFSDEANEQGEVAKHKAGNRWGEGGLLVDKTTVKVDKDFIRLTTTFTAEQPVDPPVFGFTVHGPDGTDILESNTKQLRVKTQKLVAGERVEMEWTFPNILASGTYDVSVACCDQSTTRFYDWLNQAARFRVSKPTETAAVVDPPVELSAFNKYGDA